MVVLSRTGQYSLWSKKQIYIFTAIKVTKLSQKEDRDLSKGAELGAEDLTNQVCEMAKHQK